MFKRLNARSNESAGETEIVEMEFKRAAAWFPQRGSAALEAAASLRREYSFFVEPEGKFRRHFSSAVHLFAARERRLSRQPILPL